MYFLKCETQVRREIACLCVREENTTTDCLAIPFDLDGGATQDGHNLSFIRTMTERLYHAR